MPFPCLRCSTSVTEPRARPSGPGGLAGRAALLHGSLKRGHNSRWGPCSSTATGTATGTRHDYDTTRHPTASCSCSRGTTCTDPCTCLSSWGPPHRTAPAPYRTAPTPYRTAPAPYRTAPAPYRTGPCSYNWLWPWQRGCEGHRLSASRRGHHVVAPGDLVPLGTDPHAARPYPRGGRASATLQRTAGAHPPNYVTYVAPTHVHVTGGGWLLRAPVGCVPYCPAL